MNEIKYIVVILKGMKTPSAIVFRGAITHSMLVPEDAEVLGAGFCKIGDISKTKSAFMPFTADIECYGNATSMGVESRGEEDAAVLEMTLCGTHSRFEY